MRNVLIYGVARMFEPSLQPFSLTSLTVGTTARILAVDLEEGLRTRMLALGLSPGQEIKVMRKAAWGGPLQVRVGTTDIILRIADARVITVV